MSGGATRRRVLRITAALAGLPIGAAVPAGEDYRWAGSALGAEASLVLRHTDRCRAARLVAAAIAEIDRLEAVFSLQRSDSALSTLNRDGRLARPPFDLVAVLQTAAMISRVSEGAFDVTVQPLWRLHAAAADRNMLPDDRTIERALTLIDWRALDVDRRSVGFLRSDMAVTLNGIAQGYITDRVSALLRDAGLDEVLVDLGETRVSGGGAPGRPWRIRTPSGEVTLNEGALAVSAARPADCCLSTGSPNLISPFTGLPVVDGRVVTVAAASAVLADGASTALAASSPAQAGHLAKRLGSIGVVVASPGAV